MLFRKHGSTSIASRNLAVRLLVRMSVLHHTAECAHSLGPGFNRNLDGPSALASFAVASIAAILLHSEIQLVTVAPVELSQLSRVEWRRELKLDRAFRGVAQVPIKIQT